MSAAGVELRTALIAALKASAAVQATAMGAAPRVVNRARPELAFPFIVVTNPARPWDTTSERGHEHSLELRLMGDYEGDEQGEAIFAAIAGALRDWAPAAFPSHRLVNLVLQFEDVRSGEDGKRYFGLQRWRAVTEEL